MMNELRYEAPEAILVGRMDEVFLGPEWSNYPEQYIGTGTW